MNVRDLLEAVPHECSAVDGKVGKEDASLGRRGPGLDTDPKEVGCRWRGQAKVLSRTAAR